MAAQDNAPDPGKLSLEFRARLDRMGSHELVRALVLLSTPAASSNPPQRMSVAARRASVVALRKAAALALADVDATLVQHGGARLSSEPNALGIVAVEATPAGIKALADLERIGAVLEDQIIVPLSH